MKNQLFYISNQNNKLRKYFKYYKKYPLKYFKSMGIELKWYQKIWLLLPQDNRTEKQKIIDKVAKPYRIKKNKIK